MLVCFGAFIALSNCKHLLLYSCGFPFSSAGTVYFCLLGTHFPHCLLLDCRSEIAFANCNSIKACQNALSEDRVPKTKALWGNMKTVHESGRWNRAFICNVFNWSCCLWVIPNNVYFSILAGLSLSSSLLLIPQPIMYFTRNAAMHMYSELLVTLYSDVLLVQEACSMLGKYPVRVNGGDNAELGKQVF